MVSSNTTAKEERAKQTYIKIPTLAWYIANKANNRKSLESETTRIWMSIIHHYFKAEEGFTTTAEKYLQLEEQAPPLSDSESETEKQPQDGDEALPVVKSKDGNKPGNPQKTRIGKTGRADIFTTFLDLDESIGVQYEMFVVECKRAQRQNATAWEAAEVQLQKYLEAIQPPKQSEHSGEPVSNEEVTEREDWEIRGVVAIGNLARIFKWDLTRQDLTVLHKKVYLNVEEDHEIVHNLLSDVTESYREFG
ncbi:hypothetical protein GGR57DRAFT_506357 [Xylariaceae sp. FL1272]|nr:hypothetical protein GGR57DRAFT_506357 [Xylariaceae sp. FL1272]